MYQHVRLVAKLHKSGVLTEEQADELRLAICADLEKQLDLGKREAAKQFCEMVGV